MTDAQVSLAALDRGTSTLLEMLSQLQGHLAASATALQPLTALAAHTPSTSTGNSAAGAGKSSAGIASTAAVADSDAHTDANAKVTATATATTSTSTTSPAGAAAEASDVAGVIGESEDAHASGDLLRLSVRRDSDPCTYRKTGEPSFFLSADRHFADVDRSPRGIGTTRFLQACQ